MELVETLRDWLEIVEDEEESPPFYDSYGGIWRKVLIRDDEVEAIRAAADALELTQWRLMDTAPKDGQEILGYRADAGVLLIRWTCPAEFCTEQEQEDMGEDSTFAEDWFCADFVSGSRLEGQEKPTHWMPLPPDPEQ